VLAALLGDAASVTCIRAPHPRALAAAALASLASEALAAAGAPPGLAAAPAADAAAALDRALGLAGPEDLVIVAGSIFAAAALRLAWAERGGLALPERDPEA
jgi:folylpolyglutamate synthase/dihydropteroate synthase